MAGELGDLTEFLKDGSGVGPNDVSWLDVDEQSYREVDILPKQNLDIVPDLKALWNHQDQTSTQFVPNTAGPRTMADLGQGAIRVTGPEDILRTARLAIMQSDDPTRVAHALTSRYDGTSLQNAKTALAGVMAERGLLGRYYIDAADFPECAKGTRKASDFVRRFAPDARFVKAKEACTSCIHRTAYAEGMGHCSVFHKQIEMEVPYTEELAEAVEKSQRAKGKAVQASTEDPKARIRLAHLAGNSQKPGQIFSGRQQKKPARAKVAGNPADQLIAVNALTKKRDEQNQQKLAAIKARPIVAFLRREMLKGHSFEELKKSLRLAFDVSDLRDTKAQWEGIFREAGLYGTVYTTQDSFEDCRVGADFLAKRGSQTKAIVAGDKCGPCIFNKVGRCLMYGKKLVKSADEVLTPEVVDQVIWEQKLAGNLPVGADKMSWGDTPKAALKAIWRVASGPKPSRAVNLRQAVEEGFYGNGPKPVGTSELTTRAIVKAARQFLNEGLYGQDLVTAMTGQFGAQDIQASIEELRPVVAEQGLQGIKYVDPTAYDDYGKGCKEAARRHRSRAAVRYLKVGDKCGSCVHQTRPGFCSVINKQLVREPPYVDKQAEQQAVLASGRATEVDYGNLMNNGLSMMAEYELQHGSGDVDLNPDITAADTVIEFGAHDIKL